jgi:hypothetical protein
LGEKPEVLLGPRTYRNFGFNPSMALRPDFLVPFLYQIEKPLPLDFLMGYRTPESDFPLPHRDNLPVPGPRATLDEDPVPHPERVRLKDYHSASLCPF